MEGRVRRLSSGVTEGKGESVRTVQAKGMFFQLNIANSSMRIRETRPGPVKNSLSNAAQWSFHAAYPAAARVRGPRMGTKSASPPVLEDADAMGDLFGLVMVNGGSRRHRIGNSALTS